VVNALNEQTFYTYDANGNMLTMTDGRGYTTTYRYNVRNLLIETLDPGAEKTSEQYTYYADGTIATKTDRNKKETKYRYDCFGRLVYESIGNQYKEYTYDKLGNILTANDNTSDITRVYDSLGRVTKKTVTGLGTTTGITTETTT
jgi:YD repeat-containing protein